MMYLDYEVALLLAKYGKDAVFNALARRIQLSHEELELLLKEIPVKKTPARSGRSGSVGDLIDQLTRDHPTKAHLLRTLHGRFQNRTFLPELRDVKRFFEQHSRNFGSTKSRVESLPRLLKLLAELDLSELDAICQVETESGYSSLGLISDEILRQPK